MANRYRGEASLTLAEGSYTLRLTLDALARLEPVLGTQDLGALAEKLLGGELTATQVQAVLCEALAGGGDLDHQDAKALLAGVGTPLVLRKAYVDLMQASFAP